MGSIPAQTFPKCSACCVSHHLIVEALVRIHVFILANISYVLNFKGYYLMTYSRVFFATFIVCLLFQSSGRILDTRLSKIFHSFIGAPVFQFCSN